MRKSYLGLIVVLLLGGGAVAYFHMGETPEARRDRYLTKARDYVKQEKTNEAVIEFRNAIKSDPASASARYELAMAFRKRGEYKPAYQELVRATNLKPDMLVARFELGSLQLLGKDTKGAKEQLEENTSTR